LLGLGVKNNEVEAGWSDDTQLRINFKEEKSTEQA